MRNGLLGSVTALLAGSGLVMAQAPTSAPRPYTAAPIALPATGQTPLPVQPGPTGAPTFANPTYAPRTLSGLPTALPPADQPAGQPARPAIPGPDKPGLRSELPPAP